MFSPDLLRESSILVTGGGTGLGQAMAARFAALGAKVAVIGRREAPLHATVAAIRDAGGIAAGEVADVRDPGSIERAVDAIERQLGPLTALVNNAAGNFLAASEDLSANAFDAVQRIVLNGTFHASQALGKRWIGRGPHAGGASGYILLNIVTTYAWMGSAFVLPSACAKAGVLAMTRSLAIEWATYGIRANAIAPGPFPTEGAFSRLMPPEMQAKSEANQPLGRYGEPGELADLAAFLVSPMARFINGECVVIDGGEWLKAGQQFSALADLPRAEVKATMARLKPPRS